MKSFLTALYFALLTTGCAHVSQAGGEFQRLSETSCVPYDESTFKPALPAEWQPYLASTRVCPLVKKTSDKPAVILITISLAEATEKKIASDPWDQLPKPVFVDDRGECIARLPYLFPDDPPFEVVLRYGRWQKNVPGEIRMHVLNQAVDGDFDLPSLIWDASKQQYEPERTTTDSEKTQRSMRCQINERR